MAKRSLRQSPVRLIPYGVRTPTGISVHGSLALALDSGPPRGRPVRPSLGLVRDGQRMGLRPEARLIAQLVFDLLAGVRPYHHLAGYTTPRLFERLQPLGARLPGPAPTLGTVRICQPGPQVAEVAAVARAGSRVLALALRLEHDRRWRCAAIETAVPG
jgi:Family of unknown function (DUF6459)